MNKEEIEKRLKEFEEEYKKKPNDLWLKNTIERWKDVLGITENTVDLEEKPTRKYPLKKWIKLKGAKNLNFEVCWYCGALCEAGCICKIGEKTQCLNCSYRLSHKNSKQLLK